MASNSPRTLFKSLSALPIALALLSALSCSQPPAMVSSNRTGASKDAKPDMKDQVSDEDQKSSDGDETDDKDKEEDKTDDKETDKEKETEKVPDPILMDPAKEPEKSKFVPCVDQTDKCHPHVFVMADEPLHKILLVNLDDPSKDWDLDVPGGARDLQLIGDNKVLVGTLDGPGGYHEVDLTTGKILKSVTGFGGVQAVQRLANGNTLVMGSGLDGGRGMVVLEVDGNKKILSKKEFPNVRDGRMVRQTKAGTFLMGTSTGQTDADVMLEMSSDNKELHRYPVNSWPAHFALRAPNGDTVVATGHGKTIRIFDKDSKMKKEIGGPSTPDAAAVNPNYSGHFFILPNGNYILTNWQGHEKNLGAKGRQIVEYNAEGKLVWWWKQDAKRISAVHSILVLDNLDLSKPYSDANGVLEILK
ncbi:MAG: hypothetical protein EOP10_13350 [Proteobacteria bacterium]|nr:MAG: hypothetical protein EOP10_13350 [Pseudomonadota bacterium]